MIEIDEMRLGAEFFEVADDLVGFFVGFLAGHREHRNLRVSGAAGKRDEFFLHGVWRIAAANDDQAAHRLGYARGLLSDGRIGEQQPADQLQQPE